jgi:hypothetical protein
MKFALSFLLGASIGAIAALLFAPSSGTELRSNIKTQADLQAARAREEWNKGVQGLQEPRQLRPQPDFALSYCLISRLNTGMHGTIFHAPGS